MRGGKRGVVEKDHLRGRTVFRPGGGVHEVAEDHVPGGAAQGREEAGGLEGGEAAEDGHALALKAAGARGGNHVPGPGRGGGGHKRHRKKRMDRTAPGIP